MAGLKKHLHKEIQVYKELRLLEKLSKSVEQMNRIIAGEIKTIPVSEIFK